MRISDWSSDVCSSDLVAPRTTEPPAPRGLAVGDQPMPLADMFAARQPRQQVGIGRNGLLGPLDRRDQNSTEAALDAATASHGMNRKPLTARQRALPALTTPPTRNSGERRVWKDVDRPGK